MTEEILHILLQKDRNIPLYKQLADSIASLAKEGVLSANSKLPPIRKLAEHLGINPVTVVTAYKHLEQKQIVYSRVGSGTYISPLPIEEIPTPVVNKNIEAFEHLPSLDNAINFTLTSLPNTLFPVDAFKKAFNEILDNEQGGAFGYTDSMGYEPLRQILCRYLASYGIQTTADHVQIISGAQQGIDIISKALLSYGDIVFVEKPTFYGAAGAFLSRGAKLTEIPLEEDGLQMERLEDLLKLYHPRFIYVMAYFQTPTGISYSMEKKRKLLELAEKYDTYIIEEDNFYDFHYDKVTPTPLKALDYKNRVIYIKSFSKILMPGLRMGLMVLPKRIQGDVVKAKYTTDISTSGFIQKALAQYLQENGWENHANAVRHYGSEKYRKAISMAAKYLPPSVSFFHPKGGVNLWLKLPDSVKAEPLCNRMLEKNVLVSPGSQFYIGSAENHHIRLSFAALTDDKIEVGMKRIGETIQEMEIESDEKTL